MTVTAQASTPSFSAWRRTGRPGHAPTMAGDAHGSLGTGGGIAVGYEATGMVYTIGWMRGLMRATGLDHFSQDAHA